MLEPILGAFPQKLSGFSFASLFGWSEVFCYEWKVLGGGALLVSCVVERERGRDLVQPIGSLTPLEQQALVDALRREERDVRLHVVSESFLANHPLLVSASTIEEDRSRFDYVYSAADLALLKGRRYARKRNHLSQAEAAHRWTVEPLSAANVGACREIADTARAELADADSVSFRQENRALDRTLSHLGLLKQQGVVVFADGAPAAFSIFEALDPRTMVVHFERAIRSVRGSFQVVNRAAAQAIQALGFERINREDDLGLSGLRQAKESYYPIELVKSFTLTIKR